MSASEDRPLLVVLRALKLGDLLTAVPALRALARAFPQHRRLLAAPDWLTPLALHTGAVEEVVHTEPLQPLVPLLHRADVAVNLHGRGPQSTALLAATSPRRLIAFGTDPGAPEWRHGEHEVFRWCRLLGECGIAADPADLFLDPPPVSAPADVNGATVVHPGAADAARRWPADRWAAVVRAELDLGHHVVITGGQAEVTLAAEVARSAGLAPADVLAERTDLLELAATVAAADRLVCGDTGVAHLATALRTPSVVLFGPVPPSQWGPPASPLHITLWDGATGDPHATTTDSGLLAISVDDVREALARLPVDSFRVNP